MDIKFNIEIKIELQNLELQNKINEIDKLINLIENLLKNSIQYDCIVIIIKDYIEDCNSIEIIYQERKFLIPNNLNSIIQELKMLKTDSDEVF